METSVPTGRDGLSPQGSPLRASRSTVTRWLAAGVACASLILAGCSGGAGTIMFHIEVSGRVEDEGGAGGVSGAFVFFVENIERVSDEWIRENVAASEAASDMFRRGDSGRGRSDASGAFRFLAFRMISSEDATDDPDAPLTTRVSNSCRRCGLVFVHPGFRTRILPVSSGTWQAPKPDRAGIVLLEMSSVHIASGGR